MGDIKNGIREDVQTLILNLRTGDPDTYIMSGGIIVYALVIIGWI